MLLRRLGLTLKAHGASGEPGRSAGSRRSPPRRPSATRATRRRCCAFAETVFGEAFPADAVITESRLDIDEWVGDAELPGRRSIAADGSELAAAVQRSRSTALGTDARADALAAAVLGACTTDTRGALTAAELVRRHPLTRRLLEAVRRCRRAAARSQTRSCPARTSMRPRACLDRVRRPAQPPAVHRGASMPSVELHLWIRELTRDRPGGGADPGVRVVATTAALRSARTPTTRSSRPSALFPAIYCRHCGRSGWGVTLSPANSTDLDISDADIRRNHASRRAGSGLCSSPRAKATRRFGDVGNGNPARGEPALVSRRAATDPHRTAAGRRGRTGRLGAAGAHPGRSRRRRRLQERHLPVVPADGRHPVPRQRDRDPAVGDAVHAVRRTSLDPAEKKALVFTDSVQDAAHRAGFVQSRSHTLTLRAVLRDAVGDEPVARRARRPGHPAGGRRPESGGTGSSRPTSSSGTSSRRSGRRRRAGEGAAAGAGRVRRRLLFDAVLEFGLQSRARPHPGADRQRSRRGRGRRPA